MTSKTSASKLAWAVLGLAVSACSHSADDKPGVAAKEAPAAPKSALLYPKEDKPCLLPEYDLALVENGPKTAGRAKLSTELVAKMVRQNQRLPPLFKDYNEYWQLYALDTVRCKGFVIVSYLYQHEDCCSDVYYLSFTADGKKLLDWATIAQTGADGMWSATVTMTSQPDLRLRVTELIDDSEDGAETSFRDSIVTDYSVTLQGRFVRFTIDSVRTRQPVR